MGDVKLNNAAEDTTSTNIFRESYTVLYYKKIEVEVKADNINGAELKAQKIIHQLCSKDSDLDPASGMLHSIHKVQENE